MAITGAKSCDFGGFTKKEVNWGNNMSFWFSERVGEQACCILLWPFYDFYGYKSAFKNQNYYDKYQTVCNWTLNYVDWFFSAKINNYTFTETFSKDNIF